MTCVFHSIFPLIPGFHYRGNVLHSIPVGFIFSSEGTLVEIFFIAISQMFKMRIQKIYLFLPAWFLGFGLFPAITLKCFTQSDAPDISFLGWEPAIVGGLLILCVGIITGCSDLNISAGKFYRRESLC